MSKAFIKESDEDDDAFEQAPALPAGSKNYMTRSGWAALKVELDQLVKTDRPALVQVVSWAASNGDRSENGDYIYGKKRLREMDRRIRFLIKRLEAATVVDPGEQENVDQVFFGATVTISQVAGDAGSADETYQIVGVDEADASAGRISWISPLARALLKAHAGDSVRFHSPAGLREIEIVGIRYD
ncbi:MAG: transcription elongation factor GreB [Candidatus Methylophosphatis roskildensis]|uniref:Transcription elongation factor GreB n=1 Tax=Candidatus Methylophosphatis roskildensis TaxID=2899263 RepID=A0A9D7E0S7_9PROT|nr:transcription elongation factor GreB [Candidatus Methylophosphatis roskildensis]MBK7236266.1 transcription elongation factor GreB [Sterolibacteriaceae bacterium]